METEILKKLTQIEEDRDVEILFAVESGSRAWGFASKDSDYDIRFVYRHSKKWYLKLWEANDTMQFMTSKILDGSGWDLRKALRLLAKSNGTFLGWLFSPIVYRSQPDFLEEIKALALRNVNPIALFYHFHNMNAHFNKILGTDEMTLKSYFYALRTALCAQWIYKKGGIPPVAFTALYPVLETEFHEPLNELILLKRENNEKNKTQINPLLVNLAKEISAENQRNKKIIKHRRPSKNVFNQFFLQNIS